MSEATIRKISKVIIACLLVGIVTFGVMSLAGLGTDAASRWSPIAVPFFAVSSLMFMFTVGFAVVLHLTVITIAASFYCLVVSLVMFARQKWSLATFLWALVALAGHLTFLVYPRPPGSGWLSGIGF